MRICKIRLNIENEPANNIYEVNMAVYESIQKLTKMLSEATESMISDMSYLQAIEITEVYQKGISTILQNCDIYSDSKSIKENLTDLGGLIQIEVAKETIRFLKKHQGMKSEKIDEYIEIDYGKLFADDFIMSPIIKYIIGVVDKIIQQEYKKEAFVDFLSAEEMQIYMVEQINCPGTFKKNVSQWSEEQMMYYYIVCKIVFHAYVNFCQPCFQIDVGKKAIAAICCDVKKIPQKDAEVICQLEQGVEFIILECIRYYYRILWVDKKGLEREGYITKKNFVLM